MTEQEMLDMDLHEFAQLPIIPPATMQGNDFKVFAVRTPGGWIYWSWYCDVEMVPHTNVQFVPETA